MAQRKKSLRIVYPAEQNYACQDCPARCCRTPWGIPVAPEVAHIALQDEELRARLIGRAPGILARGTLPMVERERQLQCVFLEDDYLCGLQTRHGHEALPEACQAYPFGFIHNERGEEVALLSKHCPSIRDNYGKPLSGQIEAKFKQAGGARKLTSKMGLRSGRTLSRDHYILLVNEWETLLKRHSPLDAIVEIYEFTDRFDTALPELKAPSQKDIGAAIVKVGEAQSPSKLSPRRRPTFAARLFYAHLLGNLSYPSRVLTEFSAERPRLGQWVGSWANKLAWLLGVGSVDLLYVPKPVKIAKIAKLPNFLYGNHSGIVTEYLLEVLRRRQAFTQQTYLTRSVVDLGLITALISRFAKASAVGHGRSEVARADILEGLGVADLLMAHQADTAQSSVLANLRLQLMSDPGAFKQFLASEA